MSGDTFDFLQGSRETLTGTLHDPAATPGDVLTVQANGSVAAVPGGGSMPVAWRGPFVVDFAAWDATLLGTGNDGIAVAGFAPTAGTQILRALVDVKTKFLVGGFVPNPEFDFYDVTDLNDPPTYFGSFNCPPLSPDPTDFVDQWQFPIGDASPPIGGYPDNYVYMIEERPGGGGQYAGSAVICLADGVGAALGPFSGQPTQGHAEVWLETFIPS